MEYVIKKLLYYKQMAAKWQPFLITKKVLGEFPFVILNREVVRNSHFVYTNWFSFASYI